MSSRYSAQNRAAERIDHCGADRVRIAKNKRLRMPVVIRQRYRENRLPIVVARRVQAVHLPPSEDRVSLVDLPIDFRYRLVLILIGSPAERNFPACIGSGRVQTFQDLESRPRKERCIDAIVHEWRSQGDGAAALALRGCIGRPVAGEHLRRWNIRRRALRVCSLERRLDASEEEQLVPDDRTADHAAKLIAFQRILFGSKRVARVEHPVAHELEETAVKLVRAGLRDGIDGARGNETRTARARRWFLP